MIDVGYAGALVGGILTLLSPCSAILLPGFFAYAFTSTRTLSARTLIFYAGLITTLVPLGVAASTLGLLLNQHRSVTVQLLAGLVITLGVLQTLGVQLRLPTRSSTGTGRDATAPMSIYLLGMGYGVAGVCSGPILGSVLAMAAMGPDPIYGGLLLMIYALGMTVPLLALALLWDHFHLGSRRWLRPRGVTIGPVRTTNTNIVSGLLFIIIGVIMIITGGTTELIGILSVGSQYTLESSLQTWAARVPDLAVIATVAAVVLIVAVPLRRHGGPASKHLDTRTPVRKPEEQR